MKTRRIIIAVIALLVAAGTVKAQPLVDGWRKIQTGAEGNLYDICCIDADHIWVCAQDGGLLKSSDGGETWVRKHIEEGFAMSRIKFANADVGYAMGVRDNQNMVLLKTVDAGETWIRVADTALDSVAVGREEWRFGDWQLIGTDTLYLFESENIYDCCGWASLYRSTDGGHSFHKYNHWQELPYASPEEYRSAKAIGLHFEGNEGYCIFSSTATNVVNTSCLLGSFRTTDYGQTWTRSTLFIGHYNQYPSNHFKMALIHVINNLEARLFNRSGYFDTQDGFASVNLMYENWEYGAYYEGYDLNPDGPFDLKFVDDRHGCFIGVIEDIVPWMLPNSGAFVTNDGGETWKVLMNGMESNHPAFAVDGVDTTFYVTSDRGIVYKRCLVNGPQAVMEGASPEGIAVSPTLTDGVVTVSGESLVELQVYNTLGQRILTLQPSESIATIDLTGQPAGMYFISVTDQNGVRCVKKIVKQ